MAGMAATASRAKAFRPSFHLIMALAMAGFVFGGFGMTYLGPLANGTMPPTPPIVHLHGICFFAWMVWLVMQSALINGGNVRLHRSLGTLGIALGGSLVLVGSLITVIGATTGAHSMDDLGLFYLSIVAPPSFGVLFALAIRSIRRPAVHRNLMLIATLAILMPGINRLYMQGLGLDFVPFYSTYLTMDVMLAAILYHERRVTGSVSRATWIGSAVILVPQILLRPAMASQWLQDSIDWMSSLVYYR